MANGLNFYDLKKTLTPGFALPWGYIHVYHHSSQTSLFISQVSGERLQDHWSSGINLVGESLPCLEQCSISQSKLYIPKILIQNVLC